jgi:dihydrodipicolinate synthase/N-acetylneuraminate lyase
MIDAPATFTMSITPFTADEAIDEASLRQHLSFLGRGKVGVYLCSQGSGEGDLMSIEERIRVYEIGVDVLKGTTPVYAAGVGLGHSTARIVALAKGACRANVDAVYVLGPRPGALAPSPNEIERYFRDVIEVIDRPVVISNNSSLQGYSFAVQLIERLVTDYEHVREVLIADQVGSLMSQVTHLARTFGDRITIRVGMSNQALLAHALGARGMLNFEANIAPRLTESIWSALHTGEADIAIERFRKFMDLNMLCAKFGNPRVIKDALRHLGGHPGQLRKPYLPLSSEQYDELARGLDALQLHETESYG